MAFLIREPVLLLLTKTRLKMYFPYLFFTLFQPSDVICAGDLRNGASDDRSDGPSRRQLVHAGCEAVIARTGNEPRIIFCI